MTTGFRPYLSVVASSRNDDHGGGMLQRLAVFAHALAGQSERFRLAVELVLVDWNPPADTPSLADAITWPADSRWFSTRVVVVPPHLHRSFAIGDRIPFLQMPAKNVGIRRASAPFVLATNVDIVISDRLMAALAERRLREGRFYRVDRYDVDATLNPGDPVEVQLATCRRHVIRTCRWYGTLDRRTGELFAIHSRLSRLPGPFGRWLKVPVYGLRHLGALTVRALRKYGRTLRSTAPTAQQARVESTPSQRLAAIVGRGREQWTREKAALRLHGNACGDFTLMSRADWHRLKGYAELPSFSMHLDSILLYHAHYAGLRQALLPGPVFHLEHGGGFKPEESQALYERLTAARIPYVSDADLSDLLVAMYRRGGAVLPPNPDNWGLGGEDLPERHVGARTVSV